MHVGSVMVFQPPDQGFDYDRLVSLITNRIAFVPRYRQRIREVPGRLANPVWVDDVDFDITYHVRRSALPRPGSDDQLQEFVARSSPSGWTVEGRCGRCTSSKGLPRAASPS